MDPFALTGPPPSFQASLLDLDSDFRTLLARLEANRAKLDADKAYGPEPRALAEKADAPDEVENDQRVEEEAEPAPTTPPDDAEAVEAA